MFEVKELGMVSGTKIGRGSTLSMGSSTVLGFWGAGADELLELLGEKVLEDILNQMKIPKKISKKLGKIGNKVLAEKPNGRNVEEEKWKNSKKKKGSKTNLGWSERCRRAAKAIETDLKGT